MEAFCTRHTKKVALLVSFVVNLPVSHTHTPSIARTKHNSIIEKTTMMIHLDFGLDLPQFPPREDLDVGADLLPRPRLSRP